MVGSTHGENFGEVASKVLDVKSLLRPPLFSGLDKEWAEWRFRMDNTWTILGVDQLMKWCITTTDQDLDPEFLGETQLAVGAAALTTSDESGDRSLWCTCGAAAIWA